MTSRQGGPGNKPKKPDATMFQKRAGLEDAVAFVAAIIALQRCMQIVVFPERFPQIELAAGDVDFGAKRRRLKALIEELLREIKNMPTEGATEVLETAGKQIAIAMVEQLARALDGDIARAGG
jgi:hypothetical protein